MTDTGKGLAEFRQTIQKLKDEEARLGKTAYFTNVNSSELTEEDRDIYRRLMNGILLLEMDFYWVYEARVLAGGNISRGYFKAYIGNKLTYQQWLHEEEQRDVS